MAEQSGFNFVRTTLCALDGGTVVENTSTRAQVDLANFGEVCGIVSTKLSPEHLQTSWVMVAPIYSCFLMLRNKTIEVHLPLDLGLNFVRTGYRPLFILPTVKLMQTDPRLGRLILIRLKSLKKLKPGRVRLSHLHPPPSALRLLLQLRIPPINPFLLPMVITRLLRPG